jgi:hypothetical protein
MQRQGDEEAGETDVGNSDSWLNVNLVEQRKTH